MPASIYAAEVERAIEGIAGVADAVVGLPDATRGEVAAAFVVLREPGALTAEEVPAASRAGWLPIKFPGRSCWWRASPRPVAAKFIKMN